MYLYFSKIGRITWRNLFSFEYVRFYYASLHFSYTSSKPFYFTKSEFIWWKAYYLMRVNVCEKCFKETKKRSSVNHFSKNRKKKIYRKNEFSNNFRKFDKNSRNSPKLISAKFSSFKVRKNFFEWAYSSKYDVCDNKYVKRSVSESRELKKVFFSYSLTWKFILQRYKRIDEKYQGADWLLVQISRMRISAGHDRIFCKCCHFVKLW